MTSTSHAELVTASIPNSSLSDNTFNFVSGKDITESHFTLVASNSLENQPEQDDSKSEKFVTATSYPSELTSGLYFYHVDAGYSSVTGKMLYMK